MMSDFEELDKFPSVAGWSLKIYTDPANCICGLQLRSLFGRTRASPKQLLLPTVHTILINSLNKFTYYFCGFGAAGIYYSSNYVATGNNFSYLEGNNSKILGSFGIDEPLKLSLSFSPGACADPMTYPDFKTMLGEQETERESNATRLKIIKDEIERLRKLKAEISSNKDVAKLENLKASIGLVYKIAIPDGTAVLPMQKVNELRVLKPKPDYVLPALNSILSSEHTDVEQALNALKEKLNMLQSQKFQDMSSTLKSMEQKWKNLQKDHVPSTLFINTISHDAMEQIRDKILSINDDVRVFDSEMDLIGFVRDLLEFEETKLKNLKEAFSKPDKYSDIRSTLLTDKLMLENKIARFRCDLSGLENQLNSAEKEDKKREAYDKYSKMSGASFRMRKHIQCCSID